MQNILKAEMNSLVLIYVGYSHTSGVTGGYTIINVKKLGQCQDSVPYVQSEMHPIH